MKRRKVVAWGIACASGGLVHTDKSLRAVRVFPSKRQVESLLRRSCWSRDEYSPVRLVEHDPAREAVVREAEKLIARLSAGSYPSLRAAVDRLQQKRKGR